MWKFLRRVIIAVIIAALIIAIALYAAAVLGAVAAGSSFSAALSSVSFLDALYVAIGNYSAFAPLVGGSPITSIVATLGIGYTTALSQEAETRLVAKALIAKARLQNKAVEQSRDYLDKVQQLFEGTDSADDAAEAAVELATA